jgi:hypothetical protein
MIFIGFFYLEFDKDSYLCLGGNCDLKALFE